MNPAVGQGHPRIPLGDLGSLRAGYTQRSSDRGLIGEHYWRSLQARDVGDDGTVVWGELGHVAAATDLERYRVRAGDVLIPMRSARVQAVTWKDVPPSVVAVGHWAMLTPRADMTSPEYLAVYFDQPTVRARLEGLQRGASIRFISMKDLKAFLVDVPPLVVQDKVVRVAGLHARLEHLEQELSEARATLVRTAIQSAVHPTTNPRNA